MCAACPERSAVKRWLLLVAMALATAGAPAGCVPDAPPRIELAEGTAVAEKLGLVLWVDGFDIETFQQLRREGRLPNISRYLVDRGVTVRRAVACLPTITYANNVSFHTGLLPGHHHIVGNKWFDRHRLVFQDYGSTRTYRQVDGDFSAATIHELLADELTVSILTPVRRGAARHIDNWATAGVAWFFGFQETVNHLTTLRFELIGQLADRVGRWPRFILAYFVAPDTVAHAHGPEGRAYTDILLDVDRQVGHICRALNRAGLLERTYLTLISDHGFVATPRHLDVAAWFREKLAVPTASKPFGRDVPLERRAAHFERVRAVVVSGGDRRCNIYLRAGPHWWRRPSAEQIEAFPHPPAAPGAAPRRARRLSEMLAAPQAVELVVVRLGDDAAGVRSRSGAGEIDRIRRAGRKRYRYRVLSGTDPLGYSSIPAAAKLIDGAYHDADAWLAATVDTPKPDCVPQLIELNDSHRSGDVVLFAADGWDFGRSNRGGHGGLLRHEIIVPWVWAGPDLPAGASIPVARTVDLMPTMLHLLGRDDRIPAGLDGRSLAEQLKRAGR